jgi:hypothetical protein
LIVLRVTIAGASREHRFDRTRVTIGSARGADLRSEDAGWPPLAATLRVRGAQVILDVRGRVGEVPLSPGQPLTLGRAQLTLLSAPLPPPTDFGDYDTATPPTSVTSSRFELEPQASPAAPTSAPAGAPAASASLSTPAHVAPASLPPGPPAPGKAPAAPAAATTETASPARARPGRGTVPVPADPFARRSGFDDELYAQLKRAPWFGASLALHLLLVLAFWLFASPVERGGLGGQGRVASALVDDAPAEEAALEQEEHLAHEDTSPILPEVPELPSLDDLLTPTPLEDPTIELGPFTIEDEPPSHLGTAPTIASVGRRTAPRPSRPKPAPSIDLELSFAKESVHDARRQAAEHVRQGLGLGRGGPGESLERLTADDIVVVQGEYDHQERVLRELKIPYRSVGPTEPTFVSGEVLKKARFVFWNCGMAPSDRLLERLAPSLRGFVERGGYLFTSDWVIGHVLVRAFGEFVSTSGAAAALPELVVDIQPVAAHASHPLLEGVFQPGKTGRWWLEARTLDVRVKDPQAVTVLIESPELHRNYRASPAVAVTFQHGRGRVLHVLGHYDQEAGNLAGVVAVQRIALNFVLMSLREKPLR